MRRGRPPSARSASRARGRAGSASRRAGRGRARSRASRSPCAARSRWATRAPTPRSESRTCPNWSTSPASSAALELVALGDDDDREVLAAVVPALDLLAGVLDRDRVLGDQDHVGAAGDAADDRDPARVPAHHLEHHHAVVRLGGGVQPVDRLGADVDRGVEAEGVVGARRGRCRSSSGRRRPGSRARRAVAPRRRACPRRRSRRARRGPRAAKCSSTASTPPSSLYGFVREVPRIVPPRGSRPGDLAAAERLEDPVDEPAPALADADHLVPARERPPRDGADDRVQPGAVAAAGEDSDLHGASYECRRWESNPHGAFTPLDFESGASASSATSALAKSNFARSAAFLGGAFRFES